MRSVPERNSFLARRPELDRTYVEHIYAHAAVGGSGVAPHPTQIKRLGSASLGDFLAQEMLG